MKHYYVPQFFLKRWVDAVDKVHVFQVRNGSISSRARSPEYTGFEYDLYGLVANALGVGQDHLEKRLFGPIDSNAAIVLGKLERHEMLSEDEHAAWTFFLSSLRMRQPDVLAFLRNDGIARMKADLAKRDAVTLQPDAMTTEEWFARTYPGGLEAMTLTNWLPRMRLNADQRRSSLMLVNGVAQPVEWGEPIGVTPNRADTLLLTEGGHTWEIARWRASGSAGEGVGNGVILSRCPAASSPSRSSRVIRSPEGRSFSHWKR